MSTLSIGQLAKAAKVNLETIRYYERRGLLPEPPRNKSGHRQYSSDALVRTTFIKKAQSLEFGYLLINFMDFHLNPALHIATGGARRYSQ